MWAQICQADRSGQCSHGPLRHATCTGRTATCSALSAAPATPTAAPTSVRMLMLTAPCLTPAGGPSGTVSGTPTAALPLHSVSWREVESWGTQRESSECLAIGAQIQVHKWFLGSFSSILVKRLTVKPCFVDISDNGNLSPLTLCCRTRPNSLCKSGCLTFSRVPQRSTETSNSYC